MNSPWTYHPGEGTLLRFLDGELSSREAKQVQLHLEACWQCRAELEEMQRSISECVRYRGKVLASCLPDPPAPWFDIYRGFAQTEAALQESPKMWNRFGTLWRRWALATGLALVVWAAVTQIPRFLPRPPVQPLRVDQPQTPPVTFSQPRAAPPRAPVLREVAATPGDELRVLAVLRRLGADLGEPVVVQRKRGQILVTGAGIDAELRRQIEASLQPMPRVAVRFSDPEPAQTRAGSRSGEGVSLRPDIARLQSDLEKHLGSRAAYEQFTNQVLDNSEELMSRAHALRRLAHVFDPAAEALLAPDERRLLRDLRREHAESLVKLVAALEQSVPEALAELGAQAKTPVPSAYTAASWQALTEELFQEARRSEALLAVLLGGAASEMRSEAVPHEILSTLARLRARVDQYAREIID